LLQTLFDTDKSITARKARQLMIKLYNYQDGLPSETEIVKRFGCQKV
jgi:hypothetical protein